MRVLKPAGSLWSVLLAVLLSCSGVNASETGGKNSVQAPQAVSTVAVTQAKARRQGMVNVRRVSWACSDTRCSTSTLPAVVATPVPVCQGLAREVGVIRSFTVANRSLDSKELQLCNGVIPKVSAALPVMAAPNGAGLATPPALVSDPAKKLVPAAIMKQKETGYPENWVAPDLPADKSPVFGDMKNDLRKNDQAGTASTKKPFRAKASAQPPAEPRPVVPFASVALRTEQLTLTGTGVAETSYRFTPVAVRTTQLTLTGVGVAGTVYRFTPVAVRTPLMTLTGFGRSE